VGPRQPGQRPGRTVGARWAGLLVTLALVSGCGSPGGRQAATAVEVATPVTAPATLAAAPTVAGAVPAAPRPTAAPPPSSTPPALAIQSFAVTVEDAPAGKRLTFTWATTGATAVRIHSGASVRYASEWPVPPSGTQTVEFADTYYANPAMTLIATDAAGHEVRQSITAAWPCRCAYFFSPAPDLCPSAEPTSTQAAEQRFEKGRMLWLKELHYRSETASGVILAFYDDGSWARFDDTWREGDPEADPAIVAPAGRLQPIRGFGKVWREHAEVRAGLGWALEPERAFTATWQPQMRESLPGVEYVRTLEGQVIEYTGMAEGVWRAVAP